jgi:dTDP-4-dehydrorhamnose reductase
MPTKEQLLMAGAAVAAAVVAIKVLKRGDGALKPVAKGKQRYLVFGKNGWIGGMLQELLTSSGKEFYLAQSRCENRESVKAELLKIKPTHVLNSAGVTGMPNVDWCEFNQEQALRSNVLGSMTVSDLCQELGIHCTLYATGCIFEYDAEHVIGGKGFTEEDMANFDGSFYSKTKVGDRSLLTPFSVGLSEPSHRVASG